MSAAKRGAMAGAARAGALGAAAAILFAVPGAARAAGKAAPRAAERTPAEPGPRGRVELSAGTDGAAAALFLVGAGGRLSAGLRAGLGYEMADFRWDDPAAALAVRWRVLGGRRWTGWLGAEAGLGRIDAGYDRFLCPFAAAVAGGNLRCGGRLSVFAEAGGRYGRRDREDEAALPFLTVRYAETYVIDPLLIRLGLAFDL